MRVRTRRRGVFVAALDPGEGDAVANVGAGGPGEVHERGVELPDYLEVYTSASDRDSVAGAIEEHKVGWTPVQRPEFGDALLFRILGQPMHVGIMLDGDDFLHAFQNCNTCIERLTDLSWSRRLVGAYRWVQ